MTAVDSFRRTRKTNGKTIRGFRERVGITQVELGEIIDYSPETLSRTERGKEPVPRTLQLALAVLDEMAREVENDPRRFLQRFRAKRRPGTVLRVTR